MKRSVLGLALCVIAILAGCWPERVVWSPNGEHAAMLWGDGLYLCNGEGKLFRPLAGAWSTVAWLPDSLHCLAVTVVEARRWEQIEPLLSEERRKELIALAKAFRDEILTSYEGDLGRLKTIQGMEAQKMSAIKIYLRDRDSDGLPEKLGDRWQEFLDAHCETSGVVLLNVTDEGFVPGPRVTASFESIMALRVSPNGEAFAYTENDEWRKRPNSDAMRLRLFVAPTDGSSAPRLVAEPAGLYADWWPAGESLVYFTSPAGDDGDDLRLGTLTRRRVCDADGKLLAELGGTEDLAGLLFAPLNAKVRCLRDGRILFASMELNLPGTTRDMPERWSLFSVDPSRQATVTRVLPRQSENDLPEMVYLFEVSPDETRVAIVGDKGRVAVVTLATGEVQMVQSLEEKSEGPGLHFHTVPKWRSSDELCFAVPAGSEHGSPDRAEIVLWSAEKGYRCISKDWPDAARKGFLD